MSSIKSTGSKKGAKMISFFNRKGKLYVQFEANGKKYQRSTKLDDTPQNRALVKKEVVPKLQQKILSGEFAQQQKKIYVFKEFAIKYKKSKDTLKTYRHLRGIVDNKLLPFFGNKEVDKITRGEIKEFTDNLLENLTPKRTRMILNTLKAILDIAVDYEHILTNPADNIKLPKHKPMKMQPFTPDEVHILLTHSNGWFQNMIALALYTGMRQGEMIALTLNDIDFESMTINVDKRIAQGEIDTPKTESSIRKVPIFEPLVPYLKNQIELCKEEMSFAFFFNPNTKESFYDSKKLSKYWYQLLDECGFEHRRFYNTRHSFVTNMIRSGAVSILDVSQMVGHKTIEETISTYTKFFPEEHLKVSRNLDPFTCKITDTRLQMR
jgi:integrase